VPPVCGKGTTPVEVGAGERGARGQHASGAHGEGGRWGPQASSWLAATALTKQATCKSGAPPPLRTSQPLQTPRRRSSS
jgi:hypothetical protein